MQNENVQRKSKNNVKERSFYFSLSVIHFLKVLPKDYILQTIGRQLLRSATSIGANIIEGQAATSKKDFGNYYAIALKSANETKYWLALLKEETTVDLSEELRKLLQEAYELGNMLGASILTLKGKRTF